MTDRSDRIKEAPNEALLVLFANGDPQAAETLTGRLAPKIMAHAFRLLGSRAEAEDVTQEAMLRLWRQAPNWRQGEAQVTTWLYRVVANLCTDRLRRSHRAAPLEAAGDPVDSGAGPAQRMQEAARAKALQMALGQLPDRQRQAVVLRHIEELGNAQIAEIMDLSIEAVESLIARGKKALSASLRNQSEELGYSE
ncbi:RNA polymerase sigma factor [Roseovarius phycicola]|uniref:RNA polymerase sigma factor n=1 Tax=Roseovarius phycicola TaxID=3080976 RepID=A0ABZ2HNQ0_9RHOB